VDNPISAVPTAMLARQRTENAHLWEALRRFARRSERSRACEAAASVTLGLLLWAGNT
jgi:hypothetical protein